MNADCVTGCCDTGYCQFVAGPPSWKAQPSMLHVRQLFACVTVGAKIYAIGGNETGGAAGGAVSTVNSFVPGAAA